MKRFFLRAILSIAFAFSSQAQAQENKVKIVATFSILADMAQEIGGSRVEVYSLVPAGSDAHVYQPRPQDAKKLASANLVIKNGLGFEGWIDRLLHSSGYKGTVAVATTAIVPLVHEDSDNTHSHAQDPHAWQDLSNAKIYLANIAQALITADPAGKAYYQQNAINYKSRLEALQQKITTQFASIPAAKRRIVTTHDAFAYFGRAYGIQFIAPIGMNTEAEPTAREIGDIIRLIKREQIPAVFFENISDKRLLTRIQKESGAAIGGTLYSDSLSPATGPAPTYLKMIETNANTIFKSLSNNKNN